MGVVAVRHILVRERDGSGGISVAVVCDHIRVINAYVLVILGVFRAHFLGAAFLLCEDIPSIMHLTGLGLLCFIGMFGMVSERMHCW